MRLLGEGLDLNPIDASEPEINDARCIPDHIFMSNTLKSCLQESELEAGIGPDFMKAFDSSLYSLDLEMWPEVIKQVFFILTNSSKCISAKNDFFFFDTHVVSDCPVYQNVLFFHFSEPMKNY